jgi:hypothetical protein
MTTIREGEHMLEMYIRIPQIYADDPDSWFTLMKHVQTKFIPLMYKAISKTEEMQPIRFGASHSVNMHMHTMIMIISEH